VKIMGALKHRTRRKQSHPIGPRSLSFATSSV
jgi:hypothetical protein